MIDMLAQLPLAAPKAPDPKPFLDELARNFPPPRSEVLDHLQNLPAWEGAVLLLAGLIYMIWGWKIFKILVTANLAVAGFFLGQMVTTLILSAQQHPPASTNWPIWGGLIGAAVLAILAWPLMKFAVSLMGAVAGALGGSHLWLYLAQTYKPEWAQYSWVGGLIGLLLLGVLAFVIFRAIIMLFTSLQGAALAVAGAICLLLHIEAWHDPVRAKLLHSHHLLPLLIIIPAAVGFIYQAFSLTRTKKKPAPAPQK